MHKYVITFFSICITIYAIDLASINIESSKLSENATQTTQTIDILDAAKIDNLNIKDITGLSAVVSNTNISGIGNRSDRTFSFRGVSNYVAYESSVSMYVDDVPVPFSYGYGAIDFKNIKNIEVLKGPQGTQFGKGAQSGVINIYTKEATKKFKSELSLGLGSYKSKDFHGYISGPLENKDFTYALSITKSTSDGYTDNTLTGKNFDSRDLTSLSAKLNYNPSSPLKVSLSYSKTKIDDGGSAFKINSKDNIREIDNEPIAEYLKMDNDALALKINYIEDYYKFTSVTTYTKESVKKNDYVPIFGGLLLENYIDISEVTQEFRLNYELDDADFLVGAFYSDKTKFDYKENQTLLVANLNSVNSLQNPDENIALFTQYKYYINDQYSVMAGIRYQQTKRNFTRELNDFAKPTRYADSSTTWTHILPTLSFSYASDQNSNIYLSYSKGYRPGGYNYRSDDALVPYEAEVLDSFELGYKRIYSASLNINSALFYNLIDNHRINIFNDNLATTTLNAEKAYSYGAELEINYQDDKLLLYTTLGLTKSKIDTFSTHTNYEGNNLLDVPNITASLGAKYNFIKNYFIKSDMKYMGERYYNISNTAKESGYGLLNLALGYDKNDLHIELYVNNILDKEYVDFMIYTPTNNYYHFGAPRVLGLKMSKTF